MCANGIAVVTIKRPDKTERASNDQVISELSDAGERIATEGCDQGRDPHGRRPQIVSSPVLTSAISRARGPFGRQSGGAQTRAGGAAAAGDVRKPVHRRDQWISRWVAAASSPWRVTSALPARTRSFGQPEVKLGIAPGYGGTQRSAAPLGKGRRPAADSDR